MPRSYLIFKWVVYSLCTLLLALLSAAIATVIGTAAAIGLHNLRGPFRSVLLNLTYIPMLNPDGVEIET